MVDLRVTLAVADRSKVFSVLFQKLVEELCTCSREGKHEALRPQKPVRLIRDGEVGESGIFLYFFI